MSAFLKPFFLFLFLSNYHDLCPSSSSHLNNLPQHQIFLEKIGGCCSDFPLFILPLPTIPQLKNAYQSTNLTNSKTFLNIHHFYFFFLTPIMTPYLNFMVYQILYSLLLQNHSLKTITPDC